MEHLPPSTYTSTQNVVLTTSTAGATICYRTDGLTPTTSSNTCVSPAVAYSTAIVVASTTTITAVGTKSGLTDSAVFTGVYTISAGTPAVSKFGGNGKFGGTGAECIDLLESGVMVLRG